jgi:hypothetical protein
MICAVKTDELKKSFHQYALTPDAVRALEKAQDRARRARPSSMRVESGVGSDWLAQAVARLDFGQSTASCLTQRANTRRPRAPIEDEPEREAL